MGEWIVGEEDAGSRLDHFLAGPLGSRSRAQRLIAEGRVRVGGASRTKRHAVVAGDLVEVEEASPREPAPLPAELPFRVVFEDPQLLVIDKPPDLVVHPARGHRDGTLVQALAGKAAGGEDPERPGIVHRLDKDTSGLLVVARTEESHRVLRELLAARQIEREYLALVEGLPPARSGTIDAPLGRDRHARTRMSIDSDNPKEARTHFALEEAFAPASLLRVRLETGRTHQIRAHLEAIGHPVAGDPEYGTRGLLGLSRQFLHATRLAFPHPVTREPLAFVSPLPDDLQGVLDALASGKGRGGP